MQRCIEQPVYFNTKYMIRENGQSYIIGQWCPTVSYIVTLSLGSSTNCSARRSSSGEFGTVQVTAAVFSSTPACFCTVSGVIRANICFSELFYNNFQFVCACSNFTNNLYEERVEFLYCFIPLQSGTNHARFRW